MVDYQPFTDGRRRQQEARGVTSAASTAGNWRDHPSTNNAAAPPAQPARSAPPVQPARPAQPAQPNNYRRTPQPADGQAGPRPQHRGIEPFAGRLPHLAWGDANDKSVFKVGQLISIIHHEGDYPGDRPASTHRTLVNGGHWVFSKARIFIIVECHMLHYVALPIYTYGGRGLQYRPNREEHVGIRDAALADQPGANMTQSKLPNIQVVLRDYVRGKNKGFGDWDTSAYAHFGFPISFKYELTCFIEGEIKTEAETIRLLKLYYEYCVNCKERNGQKATHSVDAEPWNQDPLSPPASNRPPGANDEGSDEEANAEGNTANTRMFAKLRETEA